MTVDDRPQRMLARLRARRERHRQRHVAVRFGVAVGGFVVVLAGIAMLVLPGPGLVVIAAGLALLALEFAWAERTLHWTVRRAQTVGSDRRGKLLAGVGAAVAVVVAFLFFQLLQ